MSILVIYLMLSMYITNYKQQQTYMATCLACSKFLFLQIYIHINIYDAMMCMIR